MLITPPTITTMRTSCDQYKLRNGTIINVLGSQQPPEGSTLWNGFDYSKQEWVFQGKKDIRTLEELRTCVGK